MRRAVIKTNLTALVRLTFLLLLLTLLLNNNMASASKVPESRPITNEKYANKETLQPFGTVLQVDELKHWSPDKDPDAKYNRSGVSLKKRYMGPLVNPNASTEAKVMSLAMSNPRASQGKSQGGKGVNEYAFTFFQYLDTYNYWGGSSHEGIIAIPPPEHIDAAHTNGVKATGTIFFPWGDPEFVGEAMTQFTEQDENGNYIIADKLFEIAEYYGFEGFFINQESSVSKELADKLRDMLVYIQDKKPEGFVMQWYDAMVESGSISHQNAVNERNITMIQDGNKRLNDEFFMNFNWNKTRVDTTINTMEAAGRSPYDAFATWENFPYDKDPGRVQHLVDENGVIKTSIGLLAATETLVRSKDPADFQNTQDPKLWVGPTSNPTDTDRKPNEFPGVSSMIADKTPILGSNFVTHFTAGNGYKFYENGVVTKDEEWYNRSLTDVMPTWRWIVESDGAKLTPEIDYNQAYFGGTSLKITGKLEATNPNHIKLYSSKLNINADSELSVTYKATEEANNMKVGLSFGDTYETEKFVFFEVEDGNANQWNTATIDLSEHKGKVAKAISLQFASESDVENLNVNIGRLAIIDQSVKPQPIKAAKIDEIMFEDYAHAEARIFWDIADQATLYSIHRIKADGSKEFIGATPNTAFYIDLFEKDGTESGFDFEITPISKTGVKGDSKALHFEWSIPEGTSEFVDRTNRENFALNKPGFANKGDDSVSKLNDGIITSSKWLADGRATESFPHVATFDLGEEKEISRWVVHHANAPGAGESPDMNTVDFKFRYAGDDGEPLLDGNFQDRKSRIDKLDFIDADVVKDNRLDVTDRNLDEPIKARYIQLYVTNGDRSPWTATRIYEFEVYKDHFSAKTKPINMQYVKALNNIGATDTVTVSNVSEGDKVSLYSDLTTETVLAEKVATENGIVEFTDLDFGSDAGRIYYTVKAPDLLESIRRSVPFDAESGEQIAIPDKENILLVRSLKGNQPTHSKRFGILTLKDLPEGAQVEIFDKNDQVFPALLSSPAVNGVVIQERIPLEDDKGKIYVRIIKEGIKSSDRFEIEYDSSMSGDTTSLKQTINKYNKLKEENYTSSTWKEFSAAIDVGNEILNKELPTVEEILASRSSVIDAAKSLEQKGNLNELKSLYEKHNVKEEERYSIDSWAEFKAVLDAVKVIIDKDDSIQAELDEAMANLEQAVEKLVEANVKEVMIKIDEEVLEISKKVGSLTLQALLDNDFLVNINLEEAELISDSPDVASVDKNGQVTPNKVGSTNIGAKVMIDGVSYESNVLTVTVEIDTTKLDELLEKAKSLVEEEDIYTKESLQTLANAIELTEKALEIILTEEDLTNATETLEGAIKELDRIEKPTVDLSKLQQLIQDAKEVTNEDGLYTIASFDLLKVAIQDADLALVQIETESELEDAVSALRLAIDSLEVNVTELKLLIEEAKKYTNDEDTYTEASFTALQKAIEKSELKLELIETKDDLEVSIKDLQLAINKLDKIVKTEIDVSKLEVLIKQAQSYLMEAEKYTIESLDALENAINKAESAIIEIETKEDLEVAISDLETAINKLELDVVELARLIEIAKSIKNEGGKYTEKSYASLQTAIKEAELDLKSVETEIDLNNALDNLQSALDGLTIEPEEPGTEEPGTEGPGTEEPGAEEPGTEEPGTEEPGTEEPGTEEPGTEKPSTEDGNQLPKTATTIYNWLVIGTILASLGIVFAYFSVRKKKQNA